jgi:ABC-type polysaccharide/polyol phosphate transport system ATPase subunit
MRFPPQQRTKLHSNNPIREHCDWAAVLAWGVLHAYDNMEKAFEFYRQSLY